MANASSRHTPVIGTVMIAASVSPSISQRWQSVTSPAPYACDTSVSRPSRTPMPKMAKAMCIDAPTPTALMASGPRGPTINVSTTPMAIQPSSAITTGTARRSMGISSERMAVRTGIFKLTVGWAAEPAMRNPVTVRPASRRRRPAVDAPVSTSRCSCSGLPPLATPRSATRPVPVSPPSSAAPCATSWPTSRSSRCWPPRKPRCRNCSGRRTRATT